MAPIQVSDLPTNALEVFGRRARAAATTVDAYVRQELIALASRRTSVDTVVEFMESYGRDLTPQFDSDALALIQLYDLPPDVLGTFGRRARAAEMPLGAYVRQELIASARRGDSLDGVLEIREVVEQDPSMSVDMDAVAASIRYARGE